MIDIRDFYNAVPLDANRLIPNQLFQTWKSSIFDDGHANLLRKFRDHNSEISFYFFDDSEMHAYMEERWGSHPIFNVFSNTLMGAAKADIWRYCILFDRGGMYLDIDSLLLFKLIDIPPNFSELLSYENNLLLNQLRPEEYPQYADMMKQSSTVSSGLFFPKNILLNWAMMFKQGHPILEACINFICDNAALFKQVVRGNMLNSVLHFSGPLVLTNCVWKYIEAGGSINQAGIDFEGGGVFKAYEGGVYAAAEHYSSQNNQILFN